MTESIKTKGFRQTLFDFYKQTKQFIASLFGIEELTEKNFKANSIYRKTENGGYRFNRKAYKGSDSEKADDKFCELVLKHPELFTASGNSCSQHDDSQQRRRRKNRNKR